MKKEKIPNKEEEMIKRNTTKNRTKKIRSYPNKVIIFKGKIVK